MHPRRCVRSPATGCAGTNRDRRAPRAVRAASTTLPFALPTSVMIASSSRASRMPSKTDSVAPSGTATTTMSAPAAARATSTSKRSMIPRSTARWRFAALRLEPTTSPTSPSLRRSRASEPPMRPVPTTQSLRIITSSRGPANPLLPFSLRARAGAGVRVPYPELRRRTVRRNARTAPRSRASRRRRRTMMSAPQWGSNVPGHSSSCTTTRWTSDLVSAG